MAHKSLKNRDFIDMVDYWFSYAQDSAWLIEGAGYFRMKDRKQKSGRWGIREERS